MNFDLNNPIKLEQNCTPTRIVHTSTQNLVVSTVCIRTVSIAITSHIDVNHKLKNNIAFVFYLSPDINT